MLDDATILANNANLDLNCFRVVESLKKKGAKLSLINSVLRADMEYQVDFNHELTVNGQLSPEKQAEIKKSLAAQLNASWKSDTKQLTSGKDLNWGYRHDPKALALLLDTDVKPIGETFTVYSNVSGCWNPTRKKIAKNDIVQLKYLKGQWNVGHGMPLVGPEGVLNLPGKSEYLSQSAHEGALLAKVGDQVFTVGREYTRVPREAEGELYLGINDDADRRSGRGCSDNDGQMDVEIKILYSSHPDNRRTVSD